VRCWNCRNFPRRKSSPAFPGCCAISHRASATIYRAVPVGRRAPPRRDRSGARDASELHIARRAFAGVDPIAVLDIQKIIPLSQERGIGILITDHNVRETLGICDHAYIINDGLVLAFGKPDEIVYNENVRRVYLGENFRL